MISIIIPTLNEEKTLPQLLQYLTDSKDKYLEVIVVDGGSSDTTLSIAERFPVTVLKTKKGRAHQMNIGAKKAKGDILLFLHADCILEKGAFGAITEAINKGVVGGAFCQRIIGSRFIYRMIEASGNLRGRFFNIFYGDQAIFVRRDIFFKFEGYPEVGIFEDILFSKKMKKAGRVSLLKKRVFTSARRWESQGIMKTTLINWFLSFCFMFMGSSDYCQRFYKNVR